ncbi:MAG: hypothetical protein HY554_13035 [Elusimicrobia bacterium]|nr:hypothetical protein [Elusimicrobiota bacterium]
MRLSAWAAALLALAGLAAPARAASRVRLVQLTLAFEAPLAPAIRVGPDATLSSPGRPVLALPAPAIEGAASAVRRPAAPDGEVRAAAPAPAPRPSHRRRRKIDYDALGRLLDAWRPRENVFDDIPTKRRILNDAGNPRIWGRGPYPVSVWRADDYQVGQAFGNVTRAYRRYLERTGRAASGKPEGGG